MVPGFDIEVLNKLGKLIAEFERFNLEEMMPQDFDLVELFQECEQTFFRVRGVSDFWNRLASVDFAQHIVDLVVGAHSQRQAELTLIMLGSPHKLSIFLSLGSEKATRTILEGIFPGIQLEKVETRSVVAQLPAHFISKGCITGVPSRKGSGMERRDERSEPQQAEIAGKQDQAQLERVIRGMYGATWGYVIQGYPRPRQKVLADRMRVIDLLTQVTSRSRVQWQSTKQDSQQLTTVESGGQTQSYSADMVNYRAQYLVKLLERELERLDRAAAAGQWTAHAFYGASEIDDAQRLASLLLGTLAGPDSRPEPLRASLCRPGGAPLETFHTFLTSDEVATLVRLPREETPGYMLRDHVSFDVDFISQETTELPLGYIQQNGRDTLNTFNISLDALTKHVVVIGVTGSGKTTTVMNLLDRVVDAGKPFLVIEPAKTEYRALHSALASRADLHVYTLGNEMIAPFRLNPFEFETNEEPGSVSLLAHIDVLKTVFSAAFPMYAPLPQILETSLYEIYENRGWDVTSGTNRRIPDWSERHKYPIFPTLTDLYNKAEEVTDRLRYNTEADTHIKAALKARIGSLRIGAKGLMLDTARSIPMQELLSRPVILELENIGNDEEKTFLMGLFLARLYEYRRLQAATGTLPPGLQHLLVFEEAHRLLQNAPKQQGTDGDTSNMRAQAIEVFTNMLSEVRAYGQGVLVAEQIPSKLAPDVLKNTNLKIVHRLIAQDDRQSIGQTMNLKEEQQKHLGILTPGMAVTFAEGADHAYLVRLENYKRKITPLVDADLKRRSRDYASLLPYLAIPDIGKYDIPLAPIGGPDPLTYHAAAKLLDSEKGKWLWATILLRLISRPEKIFDTLLGFSEHIEEQMPHLSPEQHDATLNMVIVTGCAALMHERGVQFGWTYNQAEELRASLTQSLLSLIKAYSFMRTNAKSQGKQQKHQKELERASNYLTEFGNKYIPLLERRQGPFPGCSNCLARCLYRADVSTLLATQDEESINNELTSGSYETGEERYSVVAGTVAAIAQQWIGEEGSETEPSIHRAGIGYCMALHTVARAGFTEYDQATMAENLTEYLLAWEEQESVEQEIS